MLSLPVYRSPASGPVGHSQPAAGCSGLLTVPGTPSPVYNAPTTGPGTPLLRLLPSYNTAFGPIKQVRLPFYCHVILPVSAQNRAHSRQRAHTSGCSPPTPSPATHGHAWQPFAAGCLRERFEVARAQLAGEEHGSGSIGGRLTSPVAEPGCSESLRCHKKCNLSGLPKGQTRDQWQGLQQQKKQGVQGVGTRQQLQQEQQQGEQLEQDERDEEDLNREIHDELQKVQQQEGQQEL
ncbi:hypothetical protein NDU88_004175 [Pleurodeles waltl]|uniref:Uncharacterized protein n=1 Tax=Pleurodeles waltl TaxID=8319 RepID=A0AAV7L7X0_PLEWA|nr:hypothetical protein NDU88_004175 [Pleurodeles waltl]